MKHRIIGAVIFLLQFLNPPNVVKPAKFGQKILDVQAEGQAQEFVLRPVRIQICRSKTSFEITAN